MEKHSSATEKSTHTHTHTHTQRSKCQRRFEGAMFNKDRQYSHSMIAEKGSSVEGDRCQGERVSSLLGSATLSFRQVVPRPSITAQMSCTARPRLSFSGELPHCSREERDSSHAFRTHTYIYINIHTANDTQKSPVGTGNGRTMMLRRSGERAMYRSWGFLGPEWKMYLRM